MEIIRPSCSDFTTRFLHQPLPSPPQLLHTTPIHRRSSSSSITCYHRRRFHDPLPTNSLVSLPLLNNLRPLICSSEKALTTTTPCSLPDDESSVLFSFATKDDTTLPAPAIPVMKKAVDVAHDLKGASIFLVGLHSALKTGVGELLAEVLGYYYFDSDEVVEEAAGSESTGKSYRERDKEGFRESETEVLKQLSAMGRLVVCAGNGAVQSIPNLALLKYGVTVWIDVPLDIVARDVLEDESQFSCSEITTSGSYSEVLNQLTLLYEENKGGYGEADVHVPLLKVATQLGYDDLAAVTKEDVSLQILKELEKSTRVRKMKEEAARPF